MAKIGIDFGTTNTVLVSYDKTLNKFSFTEEQSKDYGLRGKIIVSSTVWYNDNKTIVGNDARANINKYNEIAGNHFEKSIKLKLGKDKNINIFGDEVEPYLVAAEIFKKINNDTFFNPEFIRDTKYNIDKSNAVVTIPINFSGKSRRELRKAANEAGIEIKTFIHEPFAAIIGHYFTKGHDTLEKTLNEITLLNGRYLLVFDWGGGTLDVTVLKVQNNKMVELGTAELTGVAGDKFDDLIANYAWNKFVDKNSMNYTDSQLMKLKNDKWDSLLALSENAKIELSTKDRTEILARIDKVSRIEEELTVEIFEELLMDSILQASMCVESALKQAGVDRVQISEVLLTGGTSYIPSVQKKLRDLFGHRIIPVNNPELLIAQGAAVISELNWMPFLTKDVQIELADDTYWSMFEKGFPVSNTKNAFKSEIFTCNDSRNGIAKLIICEGKQESKYVSNEENEENKLLTLGIINVPILGMNNFGDDIHVEATIDKDIILNVSAFSKMVQKVNGVLQDYSIKKTIEINKLCFGLDFGDFK
ncbi:MAG: Hsp70 family protein [bacterium]